MTLFTDRDFFFSYFPLASPFLIDNDDVGHKNCRFNTTTSDI